MTLRCRFYTDPVWRNVLAVGSEVRRRVTDTFLREGIPLAYRVLDGLELHFEPPVKEPLRRALAAVSEPQRPVAERAPEPEGAAAEQPPPPKTAEQERAEEEVTKAKVEPALPQDRTAEYG